MFGSTVLEVGIGLIFTFLTVSLICGQITETVATISGWRAATLLEGVKTLVNDPNFGGLARDLYNSALVHPRGDGEAVVERDIVQAPSYIDPKHFAQAVLDTVARGQTTAGDIKTAIGTIQDPQLKKLLASLATHAGGSVDSLRDHIAAWFDAAMDRVSGDYKRRTQFWCFFIGLAIAAFLNIDSLHVAAVLWHNPDLAKAVGSASAPTSDAALAEIAKLGFPIGWTEDRIAVWTGFCLDWPSLRQVSGQVVGWGITAGSTMFGTSFWYDALSGVIKLRGAGPAPDRVAVPTAPTGA